MLRSQSTYLCHWSTSEGWMETWLWFLWLVLIPKIKFSLMSSYYLYIQVRVFHTWAVYFPLGSHLSSVVNWKHDNFTKNVSKIWFEIHFEVKVVFSKLHPRIWLKLINVEVRSTCMHDVVKLSKLTCNYQELKTVFKGEYFNSLVFKNEFNFAFYNI